MHWSTFQLDAQAYRDADYASCIAARDGAFQARSSGAIAILELFHIEFPESLQEAFITFYL